MKEILNHRYFPFIMFILVSIIGAFMEFRNLSEIALIFAALTVL